MVLELLVLQKPSSFIHNKYPNDYKTNQLENVTIITDGVVCVNRCDQWCYFVNVDSIDHILHNMLKMFQVDVPPVIIFEAEQW